jgi:ascorbate-specific PTS system EIIC-type component UlaA
MTTHEKLGMAAVAAVLFAFWADYFHASREIVWSLLLLSAILIFASNRTQPPTAP